MKTPERSVLRYVLGLAVLSMWVLGCSSTPKKSNHSGSADAGSSQTISKAEGLTQQTLLSHEDVKGKEPVVFAQPIEQVRQAALRALTFVGCEVKKQNAFYLNGRRPNKFGLFVGSGGETVEVFLYPKSETETHVWVDTDMSFVGIAGQQSWNKQVVAEMTSTLNKQPKLQ